MEMLSFKTITLLHSEPEFLVCVKPPGPDSERELPRLLAGQAGGEVFCVHRLDAAVGGVMVYAKSSRAAASLSRALATGQFEKTYLALCTGTLEPETGEMRDLLFRDARQNRSFVVRRMRKGVKEAVLHYRVLDCQENLSLVSVVLETGRSHQIRVQFASRRHPLLGDRKYGSTAKAAGPALWAWSLTFPHPSTGEKLSFSASPPDMPPWNAFSGQYSAFTCNANQESEFRFLQRAGNPAPGVSKGASQGPFGRSGRGP